MTNFEDNLRKIFHLREDFMKLINQKFENTYHQWPLDITQKKSQKILRQTALNGVEEMFEALGHLKNWKSHRVSEVNNIDQEEFLEEIIDAFNYFFSLLILCGVDQESFMKAFYKKDEVIKQRLKNDY